MDTYISEKAAIYHGDCVKLIKQIPDETIGFSIFSPPFSELYVYSDELEDMGNSKDYDEFFTAFNFMVKELYRVMWSGRNVAVHCMDLSIQKGKEGYIGLRDFSGMILKSFEDAGFIYHSRVTIWKNPVTEMQRTKALGLLHKQLKKDSSMSRVGIPDYLMVFRKDGDHQNPVNCDINVDTWQKWASPVWYDIDYSNTLNKMNARSEKDEKHICLAEGSLVLTKRGYIPIENVVVGDETLTHLGQWKRILAVAKTGENKETVQVNAIGVPLLKCTPTHQIYARDRKLTGRKKLLSSEIEWVNAKNLKGMYVNAKLPEVVKTSISDKELWIMGRWLADGHIDVRGHQFFISIGKDKYNEFASKADGYIGHIADKTDECNTYQIGLINLSKGAREILRKCGNKASNKTLPFEIISLNKEKAKYFLDGYMAGDACKCKGKVIFSSSSRALLLGVSILVQRVYNRTMAVYAGRGERKSNISGREINCLREWVGVLSPNYTFSKMQDDGAWKPVKSVEKSSIENVYNITVEDDHSYTAEGCIVKNCPLQLDTIERAIALWSNKGDTVLTPFMGIGSEVYQSIKMDRFGIGFELKKSYFDEAVRNIKIMEVEKTQKTMFQ